MPELRAGNGIKITETTNKVTLQPQRANYVFVQALSDFPDPVSSVITLDASTLYEVSGAVDIGANRINTNGAEIMGRSRGADRIVSSTTGAVLSCSSVSQNVVMRDFTVVASAGKCLDLSGPITHQVNIQYVALTGAAAGDITGFDVQALKSCYIEAPSGIVLHGTVNKIFIDGSPFYDITGTAITLDADLAVEVVDIGVSFFKFDSPGIALKVVTGATVGEGKYARNLIKGTLIPLDGVSPADINWDMQLNSGIRPSRVVGKISLANPATTTISATDTPVKVTGTTVEDPLTERFTSGTARLTYTGVETSLVDVTAAMTMDSGNNVVLNFYLAKNGTILSGTKQRVKIGTGSDERSVAVTGIIEVDTTDYIEVWVENTSDTQNVDVSTLALVARG